MKRNGRSIVASAVLWGALVLVVIGIAIVFRLKKPVPPDEAPAEKPVAVRVETVRVRPVADRLVLPGRTEPIADVALAAEKGGRVTALLATEGDRVGKGQLLLQVDDRVFAAGLKQAEVELRDARRDEERWQALRATGAVAASDYDAILRRRELAEAGVAAARAAVEQCRVHAPIDGTVEERFIDADEFAHEGSSVLRVVDTSRLKVIVDVPERDVFGIRPGARLRMTLNARPDLAATGEVTFVAGVAAPASNCFRVELAVDNAGGLLRGGMIADVEIERRAVAGAVVVPLSAIVPRKGEYVAFVVRDGRAVRRVVRMESIVDSEVIVASGLRPGDVLVVEGQRALRDGGLVEVKEGAGGSGADAGPEETAAPAGGAGGR